MPDLAGEAYTLMAEEVSRRMLRGETIEQITPIFDATTTLAIEQILRAQERSDVTALVDLWNDLLAISGQAILFGDLFGIDGLRALVASHWERMMRVTPDEAALLDLLSMAQDPGVVGTFTGRSSRRTGWMMSAAKCLDEHRPDSWTATDDPFLGAANPPWHKSHIVMAAAGLGGPFGAFSSLNLGAIAIVELLAERFHALEIEMPMVAENFARDVRRWSVDEEEGE